jgi:D-sedoheptulose 7-phosphate isomerase
MSPIKSALHDSLETLKKFIELPDTESKIQSAIDLFVHAFKQDHKIISCGNGGSLCDAAHFAEELTGRFRKDRKALPALVISEPGHLTCVGNDYGYDHIFSKFIEAHGRKGDVLLAISTSGNSPNVLLACEMAKKNGMSIVALTGKSGGKLKDVADVSLIVPCETTDRIQEVHIKIIHIFIEGIERQLFPENYQ